ncbi:unnamed protein product [Brachionus calyciflorus]|uniref:SWIM-type domain-containing protein n=1 Tax=Brachionus calyciflorus TaxID=104777 RepID=A0A814IV71_9BILA|nr:unnamed protein product [Brachionus calyciflorus]
MIYPINLSNNLTNENDPYVVDYYVSIPGKLIDITLPVNFTWIFTKDINEEVAGISKYFCDYFEIEWIEKNPGWYEGIAYSWSTDRGTIHIFDKEPKISDECWLQAIEFVNSKPKIVFEKYGDFYLLSSGHSVDFEKFINLLDCDENCYKSQCELVSELSFDSYITFANLIRMVRFNSQNWKFSKCTCEDSFKVYMCKHIIIIALSKKLIAIPERFYDSKVGAKPKPESSSKIGDIISNFSEKKLTSLLRSHNWYPA